MDTYSIYCLLYNDRRIFQKKHTLWKGKIKIMKPSYYNYIIENKSINTLLLRAEEIVGGRK